MKILHVIPTYLPAAQASGPNQAVHAMNRELARQGVDVTVYATNMEGRQSLSMPIGQPVLLDGVKVYYFAVTLRPWEYSLGQHQALASNVEKFDLIHISSVFCAASTLGSHYALKSRKPYIITGHGSLMAEPLKQHAWKKKMYLSVIEKRNLVGAAAIHFTSEKEKAEYLSAGLPMRRALVIPNCFQPSEASPLGFFRSKFKIRKEQPMILFLGRITWVKGLDTLIDAFAQVVAQRPEAVLVIAGPDVGGYKTEIDRRIKKYLLPDVRVIFTGSLFGEDKAAAYQGADVFVLPSYSENFGLAAIEAMSVGVPTVVTKGVGLSIVIAAGGAGLVVEKDADKVAGAILEILADPVSARQMGERGKMFVNEQFSCDKIASQFINAYQEIIQQYEIAN